MIGNFFKKEWWAEYALDVLPTGSRIICDPAPTDTDEDFLLLLSPGVVRPLEERLVKEGFKQGGSLGRNFGWGLDKEYHIEGPNGEEDWIPGHKPMPPSWHFHPDDGVRRLDKKEITTTLLEEFPDFGSQDRSVVFRSWKQVKRNEFNKGEPDTAIPLNLIITCSNEYFNNFYKATKLAKQMNLLQKADRVALFEAICFDQWP